MKAKFPKTTTIKLSNLHLLQSVFLGTSFLSNAKFDSIHSNFRSYSCMFMDALSQLKTKDFFNGIAYFHEQTILSIICLNRNDHSVNVSLSQHYLLFGDFLKVSS
jgi:hypothetical protein